MIPREKRLNMNSRFSMWGNQLTHQNVDLNNTKPVTGTILSSPVFAE